MLFVGIAIGVFYVVSLLIAFAVGYGWDKQIKQEEES